MSLPKHKIEPLAHYYLLNGFDHSAEEIADKIGVSRKTFFNRYQAKNIRWN